MSRRPQLDDRIVEWISRHEGTRGPEISKAFRRGPRRFTLRLLLLVEAGRLYRFELNRFHMHYFTSKALADEAAPKLAADYEEQQRQRRQAVIDRYEAKRRAPGYKTGPSRRYNPEQLAAPKPPKPKPMNNTVRIYAALDTEILRLTDNAEGFACQELTLADRNFSAKVVGNRLVKLAHDGLLHRGKLSHRVVRFFRTAEAAAAWVYSNRAHAAPVTVKRLPTDPDAPIIIPPHVKVQRIPHAPGRFEVDVPKNRGQISADWMLARQGVDVRAVLALT